MVPKGTSLTRSTCMAKIFQRCCLRPFYAMEEGEKNLEKTVSGEYYAVTSTDHVLCVVVCSFSEGPHKGQYQSESQCEGQYECEGQCTKVNVKDG